MNSKIAKIILCIASLWVVTLPPAAANDVIVWCKGKADPDHPLSWQALTPGLQPLMVNNDYEGAYQLVLARFDDVQKMLIGEVETREIGRFRDEARLFLEGKAGRTSFAFILRDRGKKNVLKLGGVGQVSTDDYEVEIPCTDDAGNISPITPRGRCVSTDGS